MTFAYDMNINNLHDYFLQNLAEAIGKTSSLIYKMQNIILKRHPKYIEIQLFLL